MIKDIILSYWGYYASTITIIIQYPEVLLLFRISNLDIVRG